MSSILCQAVVMLLIISSLVRKNTQSAFTVDHHDPVKPFAV